jgi:DNA-binding XRE family transcriptional regulator
MANGRKTKYKQEYDELAFNYCLLGAKDTQLAEFFNVTEQTINNWKKDHPSFFESIKKGKQDADAEVANSLFHRAKGYSHPEVKVFNNQGEIVTHDTVKHYAPDPTSAIFWLKNRQPKLWRDKQEIENTHKIEDNGSNEW